jgi:hypothetical protein
VHSEQVALPQSHVVLANAVGRRQPLVVHRRRRRRRRLVPRTVINMTCVQWLRRVSAVDTCYIYMFCDRASAGTYPYGTRLRKRMCMICSEITVRVQMSSGLM